MTVILNLAQTIDGYICRTDGTVDFLPEFDGEIDTSFQKFLDRIDVIIMGRQTYEEYKSYGFEYYGDVDIYIWTTRPHPPTKNITFYTGTIPSLLDTLEDKTIWCFGGTRVIEEFMKYDLIDEYQISTVPTILGTGKRLFQEGVKETTLEYIESKTTNGITQTIYRRKQ